MFSLRICSTLLLPILFMFTLQFNVNHINSYQAKPAYLTKAITTKFFMQNLVVTNDHSAISFIRMNGFYRKSALHNSLPKIQDGIKAILPLKLSPSNKM